MTEPIAVTPGGRRIYPGDEIYYRGRYAVTSGWITARSYGRHGDSEWINGTDVGGRKRMRSVPLSGITMVKRAKIESQGTKEKL